MFKLTNLLLGKLNVDKIAILFVYIFFVQHSVFAQLHNKQEFFPVETSLLDNSSALLATVMIYPQIAEIYTPDKELAGIAGYYLKRGQLFLYLVKNRTSKTKEILEDSQIIGYSEKSLIYDQKGQWQGSYSKVGIDFYIFNQALKKVGQVRCIINKNFCAAVASAYVLNLFKNE